MATSGQINTNTEYDSYFWVKWSQTNQSVADNKTTISWSCGVYAGHSFYTNAIKMSAVTINGTKVYSGGTYSNISHESRTLASGTLIIPHNSDGRKTFTISAFTGWLYSYHNYTASSKSYDLTTIPRKAVLSSATDFTDEGSPKIEFTNPGGFSLKPYFIIYDDSGSSVFSITRSKGKYTSPYTFSFTTSEITNMRKSTNKQKSYKVDIGLETYNGDTSLGSSYLEKKFTIVNANPVFSADTITYKDTNSSVVAITGDNQQIVQGKSSLQVNFGMATTLKGAILSKYKFSLNGVEKTIPPTVTSFSFGTVNAAKNITMTATAIDSRGYQTTVEKTITMISYTNPSAIITLERVNNYEDETKLTVDGSVASVCGNNKMSIKYKKKQFGGEYGDLTEISDNVEVTDVCDKNHVWVFYISITDSLGGSYETEVELQKGKFPLFIDTEKSAVGINEFPDSGEALRVSGGVAHFEGDVYSDSDMLFENGEQTAERAVIFKNSNGNKPHNSVLCGGNPDSETAIGMWDRKYDRCILLYEDAKNRIIHGADGTVNQLMAYTIYTSDDTDGSKSIEKIEELLAKMGNSSIAPIRFRVYTYIDGNTYYGFICKHTSDYAILWGISYNGYQCTWRKNSGTWQTPSKISL